MIEDIGVGELVEGPDPIEQPIGQNRRPFSATQRLESESIGLSWLYTYWGRSAPKKDLG